MAHTPTVLIVDDDPSIRKMLVEVLALEGYPTETATNGQEALAILARSSARLILLDLKMPVLDGRGVMVEMEADETMRKQHRVVLISAWASMEEASDLVVDGKLLKPFTVPQLLSVLEPLAETLA